MTIHIDAVRNGCIFIKKSIEKIKNLLCHTKNFIYNYEENFVILKQNA